MSSTFLNQIGLGEFDMGYLLIGMGAVILLLIIFLILLIVQIRKTSKLKKRLDKFLSGKDGASLEKDIAGLYEDNKFLKANTEKNKKDIRTLYRIRLSENGIGEVRCIQPDGWAAEFFTGSAG